MNKSTILAWCDLEMTGLEVREHGIIELGLIITDSDLKPLAEYEAAIWQPEEMLNRMEPIVREMHTRNGLIEKVRKSEKSLRMVEKDVCTLLIKHADYGEGILAGNSIHTDRGFLQRYLPSFSNMLSYRMVDVSSLKILARAWYPKGPGRTQAPKDHTALSDIHASIGELAFYRDAFFKKPADV